MSEKIDPADLAPHNARVCNAMGAQIKAMGALDEFKVAEEKANESRASLRAKYALTDGDTFNPETGEIHRAKKAEGG